MIRAAISGITTKNILDSWNSNIAQRYHRGLSVDKLFSAVPEIETSVADLPRWTVEFSLTDTYKTFATKSDTWFVQDADQEADGVYSISAPRATSEPLECIASRVKSVRMKDTSLLSFEVTATLPIFKTQDRNPVILQKLTLSTPEDDNYPAWGLFLRGSGPRSGLQKVRSGAFELHLPITPGSSDAFRLICKADYGITGISPNPFPISPQFDLDMQPLLLVDVLPASEDDLDTDQYAQVNQGIRLIGGGGAGGSHDDQVRSAVSTEIASNMRREPPLVFRNPALPNSANTDRKWYLHLSEQALPDLKQTVDMHLSFTPVNGVRASSDNESVLVLDRIPFTFAEVHFHPLEDTDGRPSNEVAEWNSRSGSWKIGQSADKPSYLVMPPQVTAEEVVTEDKNDNYPAGLNDQQQPKMRLGLPTIVTYAPDTLRNFTEVPWNLRRLLTNRSLHVSRLDYEMLYGLACNTTAPQMRLTEASTLYGDIRQGLPSEPLGYKPGRGAEDAYLNARLHWSRIYREYQSRLGIFVVEDPTNTKDPEDFRDTSNTACELRLDDAAPVDYGDSRIAQYVTPSEVSSDFNHPNFKGGALIGVNQSDIFTGIVRNRSSEPTHAAVIDPRFSALGGFGTTQARFDNDRSTLINTIFMGRTVTYTVERIGRIACHWNRAKHVIVYERTVVPSRQFFLEQDKSSFRGYPLVRKVEEYVEFLQAERIFASESQAPEAAFAKGFKCGEKKRISVNSAWGSSVPGQGWKVPLWNPAAAAALPDVYPKPELYLEVTTPEKAKDNTAEQPSFITKDCLLTHPQEVFFFTNTQPDANADTDSWPAVDGVDRAPYPLIIPDASIYNDGSLDAVPLPEFSIPPGWESVTFTIEAPTTGVHATDGIVSTQTPIAAKLKTVTVSRGASPQTKTITELLTKDSPSYKAYVPTATSLAAVPQTFADLRSAIGSSNTTTVLAEIQQTARNLQTGCAQLQSQIPNAISNISSSIQNSFLAAQPQLTNVIGTQASSVFTRLKNLADGVSSISADPANFRADDRWKVEAERILDMVRATQTEAKTWTVAQMQDRLDQAMQAWNSELEQAIGSFSPLLTLASAFEDFQKRLDSIQNSVKRLLPPNAPTVQTLLGQSQALANDYDSVVRSLTGGLGNLQASLQQFDSATILLWTNSQTISGQFETAVQAAVQAAACDDTAQIQATKQAVIDALRPLATSFSVLTANLNTVMPDLARAKFNVLRQSATIQTLYKTASAQTPQALKVLQDGIQAITPDALLGEFQTNAGVYLSAISDNSKKALVALASTVANWFTSQAQSTTWDALLKSLQGLDPTAKTYLAQLQGVLDQYAGQVQNAIDSTRQSLDQYVRQPLMQLYQPLAKDASSVMRVVRAFGDPPQVPHLNLQPPEVAYVYDYVNQKIPITPVLARANQVGQALNALGINLPSVQLSDALVPADLKNFDLNKILSNFSGLSLGGLFSGIKLPEIANKNVVVTHGWEPQARRGWLQADANVPISERMVVFQAGFFAFCLSNATFLAHCKIQNDGTKVQQTTNGSITGKWSIELSESSSLIDFADTSLIFDETGKLQFKFEPANIKLADALQAVSALVQTFSDPDSGFTYGITPTGVKCAFALPIPDTASLTSGITGLTLSTSLTLSYQDTFDITLTLGVSSKDRPFNFAIFILGGCGYVEAGVTYHVGKGFDAPTLELAVGCSASLAIALGPISGGVYAQFAIELRQSGNGLRAGAFFQITGHVSLLGIVSIDIVLRLEATYANNVMLATGYVSYEVKLFMFTVAAHCNVTMRLGSGGQSSGRLEPPPGNELAGLPGPDGFVPGLAAAFAAAAPSQSSARRYVNMLL
jgi:hypothetical protein